MSDNEAIRHAVDLLKKLRDEKQLTLMGMLDELEMTDRTFDDMMRRLDDMHTPK